MRFTIPVGLWYRRNRRTFAPRFKLKWQPEMVSVQVNEEFAEREDWESIQLKEGDKVDFLYFMGGGTL